MTDWWQAEQAVGELIARAREHLGKSQYALAAALREVSGRSDGVPDRGMVARWETGRRIPTPYWRAHLAAVLRLSPEALDKAAAVTRARRAVAADDLHHAPLSRSERLAYVLAHPGGVDLVSVAQLREQVRGLDERYDHVPSTLLIPEAAQSLDHVVFLRSHASRAYVRHELRAAEAEAATLMGQLVWDASQRRDHATAVGYFEQAMQAAHEHGDSAAEGLAVLRKSFVALYGWQDPKAGLALTRSAARIAADASNVITGLALLHTGEAHAMIGERRECEQALEAADAQFGQIQPGDPAIDLFSPTQPGRLAGSCYLFLRDAGAAVRVLEQTTRVLQDRSKAHALVLGNLALAYIRLGHLDAATGSLHRAIDVTEVSRGGGGLNVIFTAGRQLQRWRRNPGVQDVHDRIMALIAA